MAKNRHMTRVQMIKVAKFLETVVGKPDKNGYVAYSGEWTDEKVASHFGVTVFNIASLRKELHGNLTPGAGNNPLAVMWERLAKLESRVNAIEAQRNGSAIEDADVKAFQSPFTRAL